MEYSIVKKAEMRRVGAKILLNNGVMPTAI